MSLNRSSSDDLDQIDERVRQAYDDILNEPLPDRFVMLLKKLRQGEYPLCDMSSDEMD